MQETGLIPGSERSLEKEMATHSSVSRLEKPTDRAAWWAQVHEITKVRHALMTKWLTVFNVFSNIYSTKLPLIEQWFFDIHWILLGIVGKTNKKALSLLWRVLWHFKSGNALYQQNAFVYSGLPLGLRSLSPEPVPRLCASWSLNSRFIE